MLLDISKIKLPSIIKVDQEITLFRAPQEDGQNKPSERPRSLWRQLSSKIGSKLGNKTSSKSKIGNAVSRGDPIAWICGNDIHLKYRTVRASLRENPAMAVTPLYAQPMPHFPVVGRDLQISAMTDATHHAQILCTFNSTTAKDGSGKSRQSPAKAA